MSKFNLELIQKGNDNKIEKGDKKMRFEDLKIRQKIVAYGDYYDGYGEDTWFEVYEVTAINKVDRKVKLKIIVRSYELEEEDYGYDPKKSIWCRVEKDDNGIEYLCDGSGLISIRLTDKNIRIR